MIRPKLTLALGATAAEALTGDGAGLLQRRGKIEEGLDGAPILISLHPAAILRLPDPQARARAEADLTEDLRLALRHLGA